MEKYDKDGITADNTIENRWQSESVASEDKGYGDGTPEGEIRTESASALNHQSDVPSAANTSCDEGNGGPTTPCADRSEESDRSADSTSRSTVPEAQHDSDSVCGSSISDTGDALPPSNRFEDDLRVIISEFPELRSAVGGAINTERYEALRKLGLTVREAYLAASAPKGADNRAHMVAGVPTGAKSPELGMSSAEMEMARCIFDGLSEQEIKRLYSAVTR